MTKTAAPVWEAKRTDETRMVEERLKQASIQHTYTIVPGGTHSMFVWRLALFNFLQQIFKR